MEISMAYMDMLVRPMDVPVGIAWGCKGMHMPTSNHSKSPLFVKLLTRVARRSADADLSNQSPGLELPIVSRSSRQASGSGSPSHASSSREAHSTKWGKANSTRRAPGSPAPPLLPLLPLPPLPSVEPPRRKSGTGRDSTASTRAPTTTPARAGAAPAAASAARSFGASSSRSALPRSSCSSVGRSASLLSLSATPAMLRSLARASSSFGKPSFKLSARHSMAEASSRSMRKDMSKKPLTPTSCPTSSRETKRRFERQAWTSFARACRN
mmetsp:Transcript_17448/g.48273  ORF Transcript_17448/g.48273 Transcript_17448/m.48273 type:complete len:269 (+) Transcript_17448:135-941(+)